MGQRKDPSYHASPAFQGYGLVSLFLFIHSSPREPQERHYGGRGDAGDPGGRVEVGRPRLGQLLPLLRREVERRAVIVQILWKLALLVPSSVLHLGPLEGNRPLIECLSLDA